MFIRLVSFVERFGGLVLAAIAALTFVSVLMRYLINSPVPDAFDFSRLLMGIVILWGMAAACYYGEHIQFEAIWTAVGPRGKRVIDVVATTVTLASICCLTVLLAIRVSNGRDSHVTTSGLGIELWPFHLIAWLGSALAALLLIVRLVQLIFYPALVANAPAEDEV